MNNNNNNEGTELKEISMFGKTYKVEDLTLRVKQSFLNSQRMEADFNEKQYQSMVALAAMKHYHEEMLKMIEEDKLKPIEVPEEIKELKK